MPGGVRQRGKRVVCVWGGGEGGEGVVIGGKGSSSIGGLGREGGGGGTGRIGDPDADGRSGWEAGAPEGVCPNVRDHQLCRFSRRLLVKSDAPDTTTADSSRR